MSKARLQMALRRVQRGAELVADQRRRVEYFRQHGSCKDAARATELLTIFEQSLALKRDTLEHLKRELGVR